MKEMRKREPPNTHSNRKGAGGDEEDDDDDDDDDGFKHQDTVARFIKLCLTLHQGYPDFSPAYVSEHINKPTTEPNELLQYLRAAHPRGLLKISRYILASLSVMFFIKSLTLPWSVFSRLDLKHPEANVVMLNSDTYRFACLISNCTRLGQDDDDDGTLAARSAPNLQQLSEALMDLPHLSLCQPYLSKLHDPFQFFGEYGMLITSMLGFTVLLGFFVAMLRNFYLAGNVSLMFIVAPRVTRQVVQERAKLMLTELASSHHNYRLFCEEFTLKLYQRPTIDGYLSARQHNYRTTQGSLSGAAMLAPTWTDYRHFKGRYSVADSRQAGATAGFGRQGSSLRTSIERQEREQLWHRLEGLHEQEEEELLMLEQAAGCNRDTAAWDCVTIMRSGWWRSKAIKEMNFLATLGMGCLALISIACYCLMFKLIAIKQARVNAIGLKQTSLNCFIRRIVGGEPLINDPLTSDQLMASPEAAGQLIHLDTLELEFSICRSLIYSVLFSIPFICYINFTVAYMIAVEELTGWLCECKFELLLGTEFIKQLLSPTSGQLGLASSVANHSYRHREDPLMATIMTDNKCKLTHKQRPRFDLNRNIRTKFKPLAGPSFVLNDCKLMGNDCRPTVSRVESAQAIEEYVTERIFAEQMCLCSAIDLLEKLHTTFRIFVEHIDRNVPTMTIMVVFTHVAIYVYVVINLLYMRSVKNFVLTPTIVLTTAWLFSNVVIIFASNFHAKATKVHTVIWSLIAATSRCSDIRIRHMRHLWLKQVQALDKKGGLALEAIGIRITYTKIIQLVVVGGTAVVLILR